MASIRTILACAVPTVTALFGIFWLFSRKKAPPKKRIAEPPDKDNLLSDVTKENKQENAESKEEQNLEAEEVEVNSKGAYCVEKRAVNLSCGDTFANIQRQNEKEEIINEIDNAFRGIYEGSEMREAKADKHKSRESADDYINQAHTESIESGLNILNKATRNSDINNVVEEKIITRQRADDINQSVASSCDVSLAQSSVGDDLIEKDGNCLQEEAVVATSVQTSNLEPVSFSEPQQFLILGHSLDKLEAVEGLVIHSDDQPLISKLDDSFNQSENVEGSVVSEQREAVNESQMVSEQIEPETAIRIETCSPTSQSFQISDSSQETEQICDGLQKEATNSGEILVRNNENIELISNRVDEPLTENVSQLHVNSNQSNSNEVLSTDWAAGQTESWEEESRTGLSTDSAIQSNSWVVNGEVEKLNYEPIQQSAPVHVISRKSANKSPKHEALNTGRVGGVMHRDRRGGSMNGTESSSNCDSSSVSSSGSSRGGSTPEVVNHRSDDQEHIFEFNMPSDMCGLFIGTRGKTIKGIREQSGARIKLRNNPYTPDFQICVIEGTQSAIDRACNIIKRKFPAAKYPGMDMIPINSPAIDMPSMGNSPVLMPEIMQLSLPEGVSVDVVVSSIVDAGRIFVQQPTHPTFPSLERLNSYMLSCYIQEGNVPDIPRPIENGVICAAPMLNGWYRAQIMAVHDDTDECDIKYVDYGGYSRISSQCLKQIRSDFMTLPFEAVECYMANITPLQGESYFSAEAAAVLEELTQGKLLQAQVVGRAEDGIPYVHIYQISGNNSALMVNREMVNRGVTRWIEILS